MSNLQLIEALCGVIDVFCDLIRKLSAKLEQIDALDDEDRKAIDSAFAKYSDVIGADELPD